MSSHTLSATLRLGLIAAAAGIMGLIGAASVAAAYETGYGPVQLVSMSGSTAAQCPLDDANATIARGFAPQYPQIALALGQEGQSVVTFDLGLDGNVANPKLAGTSGNRWFDRAAIDAVKKSQFSPAIHNCAKIAGTYGVLVLFRQTPAQAVSTAVAGSAHPLVKR